MNVVTGYSKIIYHLANEILCRVFLSQIPVDET